MNPIARQRVRAHRLPGRAELVPLHHRPGAAHRLTLFDGRRIDAPACYIAGAVDWGIFQNPGAFERMQREACARWLGVHFVSGAGHWVQQEQPAHVEALLLEFLQRSRGDP